MTKKDFAAAAVSACEELLAAKVIGVSKPGGSKRDSLRLRLSQRSVIATRRPKSIRSHLEVNVLRALHGNGAPVPRILAYNGVWLIQEDMGDRRLSQVLVHAQRWLSATDKLLDPIARGGGKSPSLTNNPLRWIQEKIDTASAHYPRIVSPFRGAMPVQ